MYFNMLVSSTSTGTPTSIYSSVALLTFSSVSTPTKSVSKTYSGGSESYSTSVFTGVSTATSKSKSKSTSISVSPSVSTSTSTPTPASVSSQTTTVFSTYSSAGTSTSTSISPLVCLPQSQLMWAHRQHQFLGHCQVPAQVLQRQCAQMCLRSLLHLFKYRLHSVQVSQQMP